MRNKKGQVMANIGSLGIGIASLCIILVVAFLIMATAKTTMIDDNSACDYTNSTYNSTSGQCNDAVGNPGPTSLAWNSTGTLQTSTATIPGWVSIIVITAIGSILIGMVMMFRR